MPARQQLRSACPRLSGAGVPSIPQLLLAMPLPPSCTSSHHTNNPTLRFCTTTCSRMDRAALDSAARTPPFSRSLRSTSRHTTATAGGQTNIHFEAPHAVDRSKRGGSSLLPQTVSTYKLPLPPAEVPSPVSWPSTPAALTAVRGGAVPREPAP